MKRNRFGINLDEGIPLATPDDFDLLHVDCFQEISNKLISWIKDSERPILLGGQIGSGKSTLINKAIKDVRLKPDIVLHFDQENMNMGAGDFWAITLAEFISASLLHKNDLSFCQLPKELGGYANDDWLSLLDGLKPKQFFKESFYKKLALRTEIAKNLDYISSVSGEMGKRLQEALGRPIFIFVSGVDKYDTTSAAFFAMDEVLTHLTNYKTLYEMNAVHFFSRREAFLPVAERLFIPTAEKQCIVEILLKRMGVYEKRIRSEIQALAEWSGGNLRQATRLLKHFEVALRKKRNFAESITFAIRETTSDFFAYSSKPSDVLIKTIHRTKKLETSMLALPGDKETARLAVYGNWILINQMGDGSSWPTSINPLVKTAFSKSLIIEEPEQKILIDYAKQYGISAEGLGISRLDETKGEFKSGDRLIGDYLLSGVEQPIHSNLGEILDILNSALLSKDRADRAIIAFKDPEVVRAARAYLFAKANSYEYQKCSHFDLIGGKADTLIGQIEEILADKADIISIGFEGDWDTNQLVALDKLRDRFIDRQMLWWIPFVLLKKFLPYWVQLRQLFEIMVLEDELLGSISLKEIEDDLQFFKELVEGDNSFQANVVHNLKIVLKYLQEVRAGVK